jgi:hypothetical protein
VGFQRPRAETIRLRADAGLTGGITKGKGASTPLGYFGITDDAGFVDFFAGEADVSDRRDVLNGNIPFALTAVLLNLAPLLRGILRPSGYFDAIASALASVRIPSLRGDEFVMSRFLSHRANPDARSIRRQPCRSQNWFWPARPRFAC